MSAARGLLRRSLARLRRSMTAQISLSITVVSILIIAVYVTVTGQFVRAELREENELTLLANLAFFRDDIAAAGGDLAQAPRIMEHACAPCASPAHRAPRSGKTKRLIASSPASVGPTSTFLQSRPLDASLAAGS